MIHESDILLSVGQAILQQQSVPNTEVREGKLFSKEKDALHLPVWYDM